MFFVSLLEIQWTDAERLLNDLIENIHHKRLECEDFEENYRRFNQWFNNFLHRELNQRLDGLTLPTMIDFLRYELRSMIRDKEKSLEDLLNQARHLQAKTNDVSERILFGKKIEDLEKIFSSIDEHIDKKFVFP